MHYCFYTNSKNESSLFIKKSRIVQIYIIKKEDRKVPKHTEPQVEHVHTHRRACALCHSGAHVHLKKQVCLDTELCLLPIFP